MTWFVVNTDNFGSDYPNESFAAGPFETQADARAEADRRNGPNKYASRYYKVVEEGYQLKPGFEP